MNKYKFPCGCEFDIIDENIKDIDGLPSISIDYYNLPMDCPATWELLQSGNTKGIFQLETNLGRHWVKKVFPYNVFEMSALIALLRPGVLKAYIGDKSMAELYCDRKNNPDEEVTYFHEALEPILKETYAVLLYQEESMRIATDIAGFTMQESDTLRKCVAKGSLIQTQNGPKYIEELASNFHKKSYKPKILSAINGKLTYCDINDVWSNGEKPILKINTKNGYCIETTYDHKIFTQDGWKKAKDLTNKDFLVIPKQYTYKGYGNFTVNKSIISSYFISEGCYTEKCEPKITNSDKWVLNLIYNSLETEFGKDSYRTYSHKNGCVDIYFKNKSKKWIEETFVKNKSKNKIIPQIITTSTNQITSVFIGCYFSAEGDVSQEKITISSTSIDITKKIQLMLLRDGIHSSITEKHSTYKEEPYLCYRICICDRNCISKFYNKYEKYICPEKKEKIEKILELDFIPNYKSFVVPHQFIKAVSESNNISSLVGWKNATGTIYNKNLTYDKVRKLNKLIGSELLYEILENDYQFVQISSVKDGGIKEVFDFELKDKPHCGFVNGILVHNSLGKKKADVMKQLKQKFIDGCVKVGKVNKEEAKEIFGWIEKGQRYLFNKSHSCSYSIIGYWSAYVKAHFPLHFYTAWLAHAHNKMEPQKEMQLLVSDARLFDIDVKPPSIDRILYSGETFSIHNNQVYFGIGDVKNIGKSMVEKIKTNVSSVEKRIGRKIKDWTWHDFLIYFSDSVSTTAINNIIDVGGTDYMRGSRVYKVHDFNTWKKLTGKERDWIKDNCEGENLINSMKRLVAEKTRLSVPRKTKINELIDQCKHTSFSLEDDARYIADRETELLGVPITCTKLDTCVNTIESDTTCKEFLQGKSGQMLLKVEITDKNEYKIKNGQFKGETMLFLNVEDGTGSIESVVVFPSVLEENESILIPGSTILMYGQRDNRRKDSFIINKVQQI